MAKCTRLCNVVAFFGRRAAFIYLLWRRYYSWVFPITAIVMMIYFIPPLDDNSSGGSEKAEVQPSTVAKYVDVRLMRAFEAGKKARLELYTGMRENDSRIVSLICSITLAGDSWLMYWRQDSFMIGYILIAKYFPPVMETPMLILLPVVTSIMLAPFVAATDMVACICAIVTYGGSANVANLFVAFLIPFLLISPYFAWKKRKSVSRKHANSGQQLPHIPTEQVVHEKNM